MVLVSGEGWEAGEICLFFLPPQFLHTAVWKVCTAGFAAKVHFIIWRTDDFTQKLRLCVCFLCELRLDVDICTAFARLLCVCRKGSCNTVCVFVKMRRAKWEVVCGKKKIDWWKLYLCGSDSVHAAIYFCWLLVVCVIRATMSCSEAERGFLSVV